MTDQATIEALTSAREDQLAALEAERDQLKAERDDAEGALSKIALDILDGNLGPNSNTVDAVRGIVAERDLLRAQRAELWKALQTLVVAISGMRPGMNLGHELLDARAALARAAPEGS